MFKKILIANRGEIAVRVARACREMGIGSAAVYSVVDRASLHVRKCDEAYPIGEAAASGSYLNIERIIEVARRCRADAIHPGYGFLSENPDFAEACSAAGIKFIGPTAPAMHMMGSKTEARAAAQAAGVSVVPGSTHALTLAEASRAASEVGFPVMLKAAAGGGGKGMRLVVTLSEMASAYEAAASEALRSFASGELYVEKLIEHPRHIEIQVLADEHGHTIHLGERECSVQRRHQKVIEESPSLLVDAAMRQRMGEVAVRAAQTAGYINAGTVEFLVDTKKNFYFLEMNTRLQVEHPVTEWVTGLDLVQWQIRIAAGEKLSLTQSAIAPRGHAIECRIYAEDPENSFFPSPGKITRLLTPSGPGVRDDSGIYEGWDVPLDYDPLLSKLIVWAESRNHTIARLERALDEYFIAGIKTNLPLFRRVLRDPAFRCGDVDTSFLDRFLAPGATASVPQPDSKMAHHEDPPEIAIAAIAAMLFAEHEAGSGGSAAFSPSNGAPSKPSAWRQAARLESLRDQT
jgi:acetyl-CoA carboxylase, biotin carboxylase subunit